MATWQEEAEPNEKIEILHKQVEFLRAGIREARQLTQAAVVCLVSSGAAPARYGSSRCCARSSQADGDDRGGELSILPCNLK